MDIRSALAHVLLAAADGHVSLEDASYEHPTEGDDTCAMCLALKEVQRLDEMLAPSFDHQIPDSIELEPMAFPVSLDGHTKLFAEWDIDLLRLTLSRESDDVRVQIGGELEMDALIELRDKVISPAIAHHEELQRIEAIEAERGRSERAREEAERARAQSFRGVSVRRTLTENMTVHGRMCASLSATRGRQTPGTIIFALTPEDVIGRLSTAMTGRLNLRFCAKCKPIPNTQLLNSYLDGNAPLEWSAETLKDVLSRDIWEGHHSAIARYDERSDD